MTKSSILLPPPPPLIGTLCCLFKTHPTFAIHLRYWWLEQTNRKINKANSQITEKRTINYKLLESRLLLHLKGLWGQTDLPGSLAGHSGQHVRNTKDWGDFLLAPHLASSTCRHGLHDLHYFSTGAHGPQADGEHPVLLTSEPPGIYITVSCDEPKTSPQYNGHMQTICLQHGHSAWGRSSMHSCPLPLSLPPVWASAVNIRPGVTKEKVPCSLRLRERAPADWRKPPPHLLDLCF